jgi:hypothetical protein
MRALPAALASLLLLQAIAAAEPPPADTTLSATADAKIETTGNERYMVTRSHTFELTQFADKGAVKTALVEAELRHRVHISEDLGANGDETGAVSLTVHALTASGHFERPLATRSLAGDEIRVEGSGGIKVTTWGCCVESNVETQLSTATLKTMFIRSTDMQLHTFTRLGKPAVGRVVAIFKVPTAADQTVLGDDPSAVAMITLAGDEAPIQRFGVHLKADKPGDAVLEWEVETGWRTASGALDNHIVLDPAKPSKPVFVWRIAKGKTIELPLVGDRFDLAAAKLPANVTLRDLAP